MTDCPDTKHVNSFGKQFFYPLQCPLPGGATAKQKV